MLKLIFIRKYTMAIGNVVQRGAIIYSYDEHGHQVGSVPAR